MNQVPHPELRKERFEFQNDAGERLAGLLERPDGDVRTHALFAHCFTCSKDIVAALHPKSFISLDNADHLLTRRADSEYVAVTIGAWARRYLLDSHQSGIDIQTHLDGPD